MAPLLGVLENRLDLTHQDLRSNQPFTGNAGTTGTMTPVEAVGPAQDTDIVQDE